MPYIPYLPNIPYFPNMPYQTDHTHHTYPTYHTTPPPHHRGGRGTAPHRHHTTGGEGEDLIWGQYMGPIPWGVGGGGGVAGPGAYIYIIIHTFDYICGSEHGPLMAKSMGKSTAPCLLHPPWSTQWWPWPHSSCVVRPAASAQGGWRPQWPTAAKKRWLGAVAWDPAASWAPKSNWGMGSFGWKRQFLGWPKGIRKKKKKNS